MMLSSTKMVASRLPQVFAARSISSSAVVQLEKSMAELLQEVPPELRIPLIKVDNANIKTGVNKRRTPQADSAGASRAPRRKETISFGRSREADTTQQAPRPKRLYQEKDVASEGFRALARKDPSASSGRPEGSRPRRARDENTTQATRPAPMPKNQPARDFTRQRSERPEKPHPVVQQISAEDYRPQRPRNQDDLFGTSSLLDVKLEDVTESGEQSNEFVGDANAVAADRDSALHRALLAAGSYSHLAVAPFSQSSPSSPNAIVDSKTNQQTIHKFAVHHADFVLSREGNMTQSQRGIVKGLVMGRLGVRS